jgi:hypothetical protein
MRRGSESAALAIQLIAKAARSVMESERPTGTLRIQTLADWTKLRNTRWTFSDD